MNDKICALVRQTWYETAKKNLSPEDRLRFYECCFEYEFADTLPGDDLPFAARLLFDMVKCDIDGDKERARERSERNRRNGAKGGRPKLSGENNDDENPEKASGFFGKPILPIQNNTEQNKTSVSSDTANNEDTHKFFEVCLIFFERGCKDAVAEGTVFWNYYAAMDWKTKGGGEIVDRLALARAWRLSEVSAASIKRRAAWVDLLREVRPVECRFISEFVDITKDTSAKNVILTMATKEICMIFEKDYIKDAKVWFDKWAPNYTLTYKALQLTA